jgi:[ribosomal protein S5]-alanine N-acetyltransferase
MIRSIPFPRLTTERLTLRQLEIEDDQEIFFLRSDERVNKYLVAPIAQSIEEAREFINKINTGISNTECPYWGITPKNDNRLIGTICLWNISIKENEAEIGYVLHPDWQGKGLMQEAIHKVIRYGFEVMKLRAITAVLDPANERSISSLKRTGFFYEGKLDNEVTYKLLNPINRLQL